MPTLEPRKCFLTTETDPKPFGPNGQTVRDLVGEHEIKALFSKTGMIIVLDGVQVAHLDADREGYFPLEVAHLLMDAVAATSERVRMMGAW
ncbi:MAG: hypothetical protein C4523_19660 [Myxococcales bacterium]|nr:MAG: hypothetical protein C4523_19660 [Myxococcales bacterium]